MTEDFYKYAKNIHIPVEISLKPDMLDHDYKNHMMKVLKTKYEKSCIADWGYIIEILAIRKILTDEIGSIIPTAKLLLETDMTVFLPTVGMEFNMCIDLIFTHGIFAQRDKIRILIPITSMEGWTIVKDFTSHRLVNTKEHQTLKINDNVQVRLVDVRFEKNGYSCIGELAKMKQNF